MLERFLTCDVLKGTQRTHSSPVREGNWQRPWAAGDSAASPPEVPLFPGAPASAAIKPQYVPNRKATGDMEHRGVTRVHNSHKHWVSQNFLNERNST